MFLNFWIYFWTLLQGFLEVSRLDRSTQLAMSMYGRELIPICMHAYAYYPFPKYRAFETFQNKFPTTPPGSTLANGIESVIIVSPISFSWLFIIFPINKKTTIRISWRGQTQRYHPSDLASQTQPALIWWSQQIREFPQTTDPDPRASSAPSK